MTNPQTIVITSAVAAAVAGSGLAALALLVRSRVAAVVTRGICLAAVLLIVAATPWFTDFLVLRLNTTSGLSSVFIDLGPPSMFLAAVVVFSASVTFAWLFRARHA